MRLLLILLILGSLANIGCSASGEIVDLKTAIGNSTTPATPTTPVLVTEPVTKPVLTATETTISMSLGIGRTTSLPTKISGGTPPYSYSIESGSGTINASTGLFQQAASFQPSVIKVTDSSGQSLLITVKSVPQLVDGAVNSMVVDGSDLFLGGSFGYINPNRFPNYAIMNGSTGAISSHSCNYQGKLDGGSTQTSVVMNGNLFLIGDFTGVKYSSVPVAKSIVKINLSTCELDSVFNSQVKEITASWTEASAGDPATNSLYIGGSITGYGSATVGNFLKIDGNTGELDTVFTSSVGFSAAVTVIHFNGSYVYVGGNFGLYKGTTAIGLAKIHKITGALDTGFTQSTGLGGIGRVNAIRVFNNSVYVGVTDSLGVTYRGVSAPELLKLDPTTGNLDTVFSQTGFGFPEKVMSIETDGTSLYVGGEFNSYRGVSCPRAIKLDPNTGVMDTGFTWGTGATGGGVFYFKYNNVTDGLYLMSDGVDSYNGVARKKIIKVDKATGVLDSSFDLGLSSANEQLLHVLDDGQILNAYSGTLNGEGSPQKGLAKINLSTMTADPTFNVGTGFDGEVLAVLVSGSHVYVGGRFTRYNGQNALRVAKINKSTGALDTTFNQATGISTAMWTPSVVSLATDGTGLYVCGFFASYRGTTTGSLARILMSNGALDATFTQTTGLNNHCNSVVYANSSIYVSGPFSTYRGVSALRLAKIHPTTGVLDTTFTASGSGLNDEGGRIVAQGTDIYVGGKFTTYRGTNVPYLIKVNATSGVLDSTFSVAPGTNSFSEPVALLGSKVFSSTFFSAACVLMCSGVSSLSTYRGSTVTNLISTTDTDGSLETGYITSLGPNSRVASAVTYSGYVILGGAFTSYRGQPSQYLAFIDQTTGDLKQ
jgi:hypothetical protein